MGLFARVWAILLRTELEWEVIDAEPATLLGLFVGYACVLAAIRPLAEISQHLLVTHRLPAPALVITAIRYGASLIDVLVIGLVINVLAPIYKGQSHLAQAMKLSVYSHTPGWVVGVLYVMPIPDFLAMIGGVYGFYILCLGIPRLMKAPREDIVGYFIGVGFGVFAVAIISGWLVNLVSLFMLAGAPQNGAAGTAFAR
ncbi:MAG: Yip1 family protein [Caulobacteraceae bacterium]